ncbi:MAG: hypothetical protein IT435_10490 [Phycisphaerales bacterium]|nr:hypothetical protein [Phycisphaerales bacterium]
MNRSVVLLGSTSLLVLGVLVPLTGASPAAAIAASAATTDPVNAVCPIRGNEVDKESPTRQFKGVTIGFCCPGCEGKWDTKTDDDRMALLAKHAPEAVTAIAGAGKGASTPAPAEARMSGNDSAMKVARAYLDACGNADVTALNALFLDKGRATVSENASDEGSWETYRDHHLLPELREMPGFAMSVTKEDVQTFGTTSIVRQIGAFTVPDPNHKELSKKYLAAVTFVIVDDAGSPKIAHLHWSSRAEKKPDAKTQTDTGTVNDICPMTADKVNPFHTREYNGLKVGFCDGDCALRWDALSDETRAKKLADAIAGITAKTPHGAQPGHDHGGHEHK